MRHQSATSEAHSAWRLFPWFLVAALGVVVAVNLGMAWSALATFPGIVGTGGFDESNSYDRVLDAVSRQAALGWSAEVVVAAGLPVLSMTDRGHAPLANAQVRATARRPLGPDETTQLVFQAVAPGRYQAAQPLPSRGQWDVDVVVTLAGQDWRATRRILVP